MIELSQVCFHGFPAGLQGFQVVFHEGVQAAYADLFVFRIAETLYTAVGFANMDHDENRKLLPEAGFLCDHAEKHLILNLFNRHLLPRCA